MIRALIIWLGMATSALAHDFTGLAKVDGAQSALINTRSGAELTLQLSQVVPYRVYTIADPARLILDFREVDWSGMTVPGFLDSDVASEVNFGQMRPGWSRMVVSLTGPFVVTEAGVAIDGTDGQATLKVRVEASDPAGFIAKSGAPLDTDWAKILSDPIVLPKPTVDGPVVVVIDPGHGGIDPGASHGGHEEADIMLQLGIEVTEALNRASGVQAILTRDSDIFVPLNQRMTIARANNADLFISLHADALEVGQARGGTIYTLSEEAGSEAAQRIAERHERGDLIAGLDLTEQDDRVASVLMDLARTRTGPKGERFADTLATALNDANVRMHRHPRREGKLAVLNAADFASVLFEVGYLSNDQDRAILLAAKTRKPIVEAIVNAVAIWALDEDARK